MKVTEKITFTTDELTVLQKLQKSYCTLKGVLSCEDCPFRKKISDDCIPEMFFATLEETSNYKNN